VKWRGEVIAGDDGDDEHEQKRRSCIDDKVVNQVAATRGRQGAYVRYKRERPGKWRGKALSRRQEDRKADAMRQ